MGGKVFCEAMKVTSENQAGGGGGGEAEDGILPLGFGVWGLGFGV